MILIAEPVHFGDTHLQVNSAFIALLRHVYPSGKMEVVAEEKHIKAIKLNAGERVGLVDFRDFRQYSKQGSLYWLQKIMGEWRQVIKILLRARKEKPELLVWLCLFPTGHLLQQLLSRMFLPQQKQLIILHGELEYLIKEKKKSSEHFLAFFLKSAFRINHKRTNYLVLGQSIKDRLTQISLSHLERVFVFQHPYLYHSTADSKKINFPLKFCVFGALTQEKNAHLLYELATKFEQEIKEGLIQFETFGLVHESLGKFKNSLVNSYKPDEFLTQKELEQQLSKQDIALFFYDKGMYQLSASGALHESLNRRLPFIALKNDYFNQLNEGRNMGLLLDSMEEMTTAIKKLLKDPESSISEFHSSIIMFLQQNSFLLQSEKLQELFKMAGILQ